MEGSTTFDPVTRRHLAQMWFLPHRLEYPVFVLNAFSAPEIILAHVGARLNLPDRSLHVDFGPIKDAGLEVQHWTVWRDAPWPDLERLVSPNRADDDEDGPSDRGPVATLTLT